jgi:hypothetical protein
MKTYPLGVRQNFNVQPGPPNYGPVADENWKMFATSADAQSGLGMILGVIEEGVMVNAEVFGGIYAQFEYRIGNDIRARICVGKAQDAQGNMDILEFPSDIFDRDKEPLPFIDTYTAGQAHVLKVQRVTRDLGQLYWAAA